MDDPQPISQHAPSGVTARLWTRLTRSTWSTRRISRDTLEQFCRECATQDYALVVHCGDIQHRMYFPNSFVVDRHDGPGVHLPADDYVEDLALLGNESFNVAVCTGLLEHVPNPQQLVGELHRILKPGGRLILSASAVFPFHGAPENYFHFTPHGIRELCRGWSRFDVLRGSSPPFKTLAILMQRILLQCDLFPLVRPVLEVLCHVVPVLDRCVLRQYDRGVKGGPRTPVEAMMPAMIHAVVVK